MLLARALRSVGGPGRALDVGAAGGGNTCVLRDHGWRPLALEYDAAGAGIARQRGLDVVRADARRLPVASGSMDLVTAFDILEHIEQDDVAARELFRVLRPGGTLLVAVPADPALWSAHDEAVHHVRRYTRDGLSAVIDGAGFTICELWSWNVLLRPAAVLQRRFSRGSALQESSRLLNAGLGAVVALERWLPVGTWRGVSLVLRAQRPG